MPIGKLLELSLLQYETGISSSVHLKVIQKQIQVKTAWQKKKMRSKFTIVLLVHFSGLGVLKHQKICDHRTLLKLET